MSSASIEHSNQLKVHTELQLFCLLVHTTTRSNLWRVEQLLAGVAISLPTGRLTSDAEHAC
jgi:hypothetical protein